VLQQGSSGRGSRACTQLFQETALGVKIARSARAACLAWWRRPLAQAAFLPAAAEASFRFARLASSKRLQSVLVSKSLITALLAPTATLPINRRSIARAAPHHEIVAGLAYLKRVLRWP